jgi:hypothetical protein
MPPEDRCLLLVAGRAMNQIVTLIKLVKFSTNYNTTDALKMRRPGRRVCGEGTGQGCNTPFAAKITLSITPAACLARSKSMNSSHWSGLAAELRSPPAWLLIVRCIEPRE